MKNPIRNETSLLLVVAVIVSAVAIPVLSGFLEPSRPPAVAAVQIGVPPDGADDGTAEPNPQPEPETGNPKPAGDVQAERRRSAPRRSDPASSAPSSPADDAAEDDGDDED